MDYTIIFAVLYSLAGFMLWDFLNVLRDDFRVIPPGVKFTAAVWLVSVFWPAYVVFVIGSRVVGLVVRRG